MKHQSQKEIHRTTEPKKELAQSALGEHCFIGDAAQFTGEAEDSPLTDQLNCAGKLAEAPVGTRAASSASQESRRGYDMVSPGADRDNLLLDVSWHPWAGLLVSK